MNIIILSVNQTIKSLERENQPAVSTAPILSLPIDTLEIIRSGLKPEDIHALSCSNRQFRQVIKEEMNIRWLQEMRICSQEAVSFDELHQYGPRFSSLHSFKLDLSRRAFLDHELESLVDRFPNFRELDASYSQLTDRQLALLTRLQGLKKLVLNGCHKVTNAGLAHLSQLKRLETLELGTSEFMGQSGMNQITNEGLAFLSHLVNLKNLNLGELNISDEGLVHIRGLTRLEQLSLYSCKQITNEGLAYLSGLARLTSLNLSFVNGITDEGFIHLANLDKLQRLGLVGNRQLTGSGMTHIRSSLQVLNIRSCTNFHLSHLSHCVQLRALDYGCGGGNPQMTDEHLQHLSGLVCLQQLILFGCEQITDSGLLYLSELHELIQLNISYCRITDQGIKYLSMHKNLQTLKMVGCDKVTDLGLDLISQQFPKLRQFSLGSDLQKITNQGVKSLSGLPELRDLELIYCPLITDSGIAYLSACLQLQKLSLPELKISGSCFVVLSQLKHLEEINLSFCENVCDIAMVNMAKITQLQILKLTGCNKITNDGFLALTYLDRLKKIDVSKSEITDNGLYFLSNSTLLRELNLSRCGQLTGSSFKIFKDFDRLEELNISDCKNVQRYSLSPVERLLNLKKLIRIDCDRLNNNDFELMRFRGIAVI